MIKPKGISGPLVLFDPDLGGRKAVCSNGKEKSEGGCADQSLERWGEKGPISSDTVLYSLDLYGKEMV
jgi:hypothetical protein